MATTAAPGDAPARGLGRPAVRHALEAAVTAVVVAVALALIYGPSFVNYDAMYALLWARDAVLGGTPEYEAAFAPTPHPLANAVSVLALPFGSGADLAILWLILLLFGALVYVTYRLGAEMFHPAVGVVAALVVLTRPAIERDALIAYQDIPFALLVVSAVLLEFRRPRRGAAVLVLLGLAGLLRPEAWVLGGLYWLWLWPAATMRRRALTALLVAAPPLIWAFTDWLVTGDALHSLHGTADLAIANERRRSVEQVPYWTAQYFGYALREPLVVGIPIGLVFAWLHARRRAVLPLAVVAAMVVVFAIGPIFGLPLIRRYVETPAVLLTLFYGLAVCGWLLLPEGSRSRRNWKIAALVAVALSAAYLPWHLRMLSGVERRLDVDGARYGDLQAAAEAPAVANAFANCPPLTVGDHRPLPYMRFWLDGEPGSVTTVEGAADPMGGALLMPVRGPTTRRIYRGGEFPRVAVPEGWSTIYRNRSWRVYAPRECARRPPS
jgi:4-amino-4-deoxy-L-arabinose transferase-like glycosyltransferase